MKKIILLLTILGVVFSGCVTSQPKVVSGAVAYMDDKGKIHYKEF